LKKERRHLPRTEVAMKGKGGGELEDRSDRGKKDNPEGAGRVLKGKMGTRGTVRVEEKKKEKEGHAKACRKMVNRRRDSSRFTIGNEPC